MVGLTTKTAYFTGDAFAFGHISANPGIGRKGNHVAVYSTGTMGFASLDTSLISSGLNNRVFTFPNQDGTFALVNNATSITATSFVKSGAATANILLAGGGDIPQSTFATSFNPTFTGSVVVPNATLATEAVNKGQLDAAIPTFLKFNATDRTVWNNGKGNASNNTSFGEFALRLNNGGVGNTAIGTNALSANTTGSSITAIGSDALSNINGSNNVTAIGGGAGRFFATNSPLTSAISSIFIGGNSRAQADSQTNQIVIGVGAVGAGSNTVTLGDTNIVKTILGGVIQKRALDTAPATSTETGTTGEIRVTSTHIYVCIATNTWVHSVLTTW